MAGHNQSHNQNHQLRDSITNNNIYEKEPKMPFVEIRKSNDDISNVMDVGS